MLKLTVFLFSIFVINLLQNEYNSLVRFNKFLKRIGVDFNTLSQHVKIEMYDVTKDAVEFYIKEEKFWYNFEFIELKSITKFDIDLTLLGLVRWRLRKLPLFKNYVALEELLQNYKNENLTK